MTTLNFPTNPDVNEEYAFGSKTWVWNGTVWNLKQDQPDVLLDLIKTVDGAGSGLDADLLDGNQASAFYLASNPSGYTNNTGTVTQVSTGTGLTGGPVTGTGTISLANTSVSPGSYTLSNITVDAQGRITSASSGSAPASGGTFAQGEFSWSGSWFPSTPSSTIKNIVSVTNFGPPAGLVQVTYLNPAPNPMQTPTVMACGQAGAPSFVGASSVSTSYCYVFMANSSGMPSDLAFNILVFT